MITKWKVFNFKSIREETELELGPLTIFAGANSSGKSTFIQSILLVAQTLSHKIGSRSVVLNGSLASLGQFDDLKSTDSESDQISIQCTCRPLIAQGEFLPPSRQFPARTSTLYGARANSIREISCEISFDADPSSPQRELFQIQPRLFATRLSCKFRDDDYIDQSAYVAIRASSKMLGEVDGKDAGSDIDDSLRNGLAYAVEMDDSSMSEAKDEYRSAVPTGCVLRHFLPERILYEIDTVEEDASTLAAALRDDDRSLGPRRALGRKFILSEQVVAVLRGVLNGTIDYDRYFTGSYKQAALFETDADTLTFREWYERLRSLPSDERLSVHKALRDCDDLTARIHAAMKSVLPDDTESHAIVQSRPPRPIFESTRYLDTFFATSLKYLGPLRDAPKPLYPLAPGADPYDVGLRGEHTASILDLHKNKQIRYIPSSSFRTPIVDRKPITRTLEVAVIDWLQYLGVARSVESRDQGKLGHELKVGLSETGCKHDLTHVGVGVSQVLPILVMCLLADTDSTLVFEQPELHLHPKVQTLLGDFFLSMALCDKQCIVETHSEYFIDRLRFRIAAASSNNALTGQAKIFFVEMKSESSSFREVKINEYGAIQDWPEGFFDQSQQQAEDILRAALAKKMAKKKD